MAIWGEGFPGCSAVLVYFYQGFFKGNVENSRFHLKNSPKSTHYFFSLWGVEYHRSTSPVLPKLKDQLPTRVNKCFPYSMLPKGPAGKKAF